MKNTRIQISYEIFVGVYSSETIWLKSDFVKPISCTYKYIV